MVEATQAASRSSSLVDFCQWGSAVTKHELQKAAERIKAEGFRGWSTFTGRLIETAHLLQESNVKLIAAVGFPFGGMDPDAKRYEVELAIDADAQEIDFFLNTGRVKDQDYQHILRELRDAVEAADERPVTVILQPAGLDPQTVKAVTEVIVESDAKGIGLWRSENVLEDIRAARALTGDKFQVKAFLKASALGTLPDLEKAGANRFGTE
jgi:deoxyribose-phosphate aldolase